MKVHHSLICLFFFLSLQDGNTGLVNAQYTVHSRIEGVDDTVKCSFSSEGSRRYFCKETCEENILINTTVDGGRTGRYSIKYKRTSEGGADVFVTIRNLTKSDSGLYRCGLIGQQNHEYKLIEIKVVDAVLERSPPEETTLCTRTGGNIVVKCVFTFRENRGYFCKNDCEEKDILAQTTGGKVQNGRYSIHFTKPDIRGILYVSITQLNKSDSGRYRCVMNRSQDLYHEFNIIVTDDPITSGPGSIRQTCGLKTEPKPTTNVVLYLGVTLVIVVIVVIVLVLVLMIICIRRKRRRYGLTTRENTDDTNMEMAIYENCPRRPVSSSEDPIYVNLHPSTRDLDQIYSTLTQRK